MTHRKSALPRPGNRWTGVLLAGTVTLLPCPAVAQWAQGAAGKLWIKSAVFWQRTDEEFDLFGRRRNYIGEGVSDARALYTDIIVGLHANADLWVQIPFFDLRFDEIAQDLRTVGPGDIRAWVRWQFASLHGGQTPLAVRVGAKAPIGSSPLDAQIVPVGEGQWDLDVFGEIGHSFWPAPVYAELWVGFRQRFRNDERFKDPGEEILYLAEVGVQPSGSALFKVTFDGLWGLRWRSDGLVTATRRRLTTVQFGAAGRVGAVWPEAGIRVPLSGRGFPAGPQYILGFSTRVN